MLKKAFIILILLSSILVSISIIRIDHKEVLENTIKIEKPVQISKIDIVEQPIGKIQIPKIHLQKSLYDINSPKNNIEENVTILKESQIPDLFFIAAHSGTGDIAYFNQLDELQINDEVIIEYQGKYYLFQVNNIYEQPKDGYIRGQRENKRQLVLTTCCPNKNNCQLIINCIEKES